MTQEESDNLAERFEKLREESKETQKQFEASLTEHMRERISNTD